MDADGPDDVVPGTVCEMPQTVRSQKPQIQGLPGVPGAGQEKGWTEEVISLGVSAARQVAGMVSLGRLAKAAREGYMEGGMGIPVASLSFDEAIARFETAGFHVASRNETEAYLTRKRSLTPVWQLLAAFAIGAGGMAGIGWLYGHQIPHISVETLVFIALGGLVGYYIRFKVPEVIRLRATRDGHAAVRPRIFLPQHLWRGDSRAG